MKKKTILITIIIIIFLLGLVSYNFLIKEKKPSYGLEKVSRGTVLKEISETGTVKNSEEINLAFKSTGKIERIFVKVGDEVKSGQNLVKLDIAELSLQLKEAQAGLQVIRAEKLDTEISLNTAKQSLEDVKASAAENLKNAYDSALNNLDDAYLKTYNALTFVNFLKRTYFERGDQQSATVTDKKIVIEAAFNNIKTYINNAKNTSDKEEIESALSKVKEEILIIKSALESIRNLMEEFFYKDIVTSSDKTSLDTHRTNINTAYNNLTTSQQNIDTAKINNTTNINDAEAQVLGIENQLKEGEEGLFQAKIEQAQAQISLLQNQIKEATITSPTDGQIIKIDKKEGETVKSAEGVISLLPSLPFQIEADIYEEDIVNVSVGNSVNINLVAFPGETLKGKVVSIDPAEKLIEGVVYYKVTIDFLETREGIKPGMTADITIESAKKENVLTIPKKSVKKIDGKTIIKVFKKNQIEEREIKIGIEGDDLIEVVSGLEEGEKIVVD